MKSLEGKRFHTPGLSGAVLPSRHCPVLGECDFGVTAPLRMAKIKKDNEMPNDPQEEIDRLKGELATARWCIAFFSGVSSRRLTMETRRAILDKISSISSISDNDFIRHESDRFKG